MAEYIEREALVERWKRRLKYMVADEDGEYPINFKIVVDALEREPTADVVEVPCRCKDCMHWMDFPNCGCTDFVKVCALAEYMIGANGYCLYGERKDGE